MAQKQQNKVPAAHEGEPELLVSTSQMDKEIKDRITRGRELREKVVALSGRVGPYMFNPSTQSDYEVMRDTFYSWDEYNEQLLRSRFSTGKVADSYRLVAFGLGGSRNPQEELRWLDREVNGQLRKLGSIREQLSLYRSAIISATEGSVNPHIGDKIFIVHGHDGDIKQQVASFVEKITGERPIILHEQADSGRTIIEKFEAHADEVGFAVILLTGDDEGQKKGVDSLNLRARQNVVFEFGYFMAKLGRSRVVALHEANVELPSDVTGILYKSLAGNWMLELAREIKAAGIEVDLAKVLH